MRKLYLFTFLTILISNQSFAEKIDSKSDWKITPIVSIYSKPNFLGSKTNNLLILPDVRIKYQDKFFASLFDTTGYNVVNHNGFTAGPLLKVRFPRTEEDGDSRIELTNKNDNGLQGIGDIDTVLELGGFAKYEGKNLYGKVELRHGINGVRGTLLDISSGYKLKYKYNELTVGPIIKFADNQFLNTYIGIDPVQSARSGLTQYKTTSGLLSYGLGLNALIPFSLNSGATIFANYEKLPSRISDSLLIKYRGSDEQIVFGISFGYSFE